jgi:hypothetical protein
MLRFLKNHNLIELLPGVKNKGKNTRVAKISYQDSDYIFRRNKTITGSTSVNINPAGEDRGQLRSHRLQVHVLKNHRRKIFVSLSAVLVVMIGLFWLITQVITSVKVGASDGTVLSSSDKIFFNQLIQGYLDNRPFERFRFFLNNSGLNDYVKQKVPEVLDAKMLYGSSSASLRVSFRQPMAVWRVGSNNYYVDSDGLTFRRNYYKEPRVVIQDQSGVPANPGEQITSRKLLSYIGQIVANVRASSGQEVSEVIIPAATLREIDVVLSGRSYRFKLNIEHDPKGQAADLASSLRYFDSKGLSPEYVDIRATGKAFYRAP